MQQCTPLKHISLLVFGLPIFFLSLHYLQSHQQQQFQQQPNQIQQQQQKFLQQTVQQHKLISNDGSGKPQVSSDMDTDPRMEKNSEALHSQASERLQLSQFQNQYQNPGEDCYADAQNLSVTSQSDICTPLPQNSRQVQQMLTPQNIGSDSNGMSSQQNVQEDLRQRITGMNEAQPNNLTEGSAVGQNHTSANVSSSHSLQNPIGTMRRTDPKFRNQQKWLLFLLHARTCNPPGGKCTDRNCFTVRKLWSHMNSCVEPQCLYPRCPQTKLLISHYKNCKDLRCPVCMTVKTYRQRQVNPCAQTRLENESSGVNRAVVSNDSLCATAGAVTGSLGCDGTLDNLQPSSKRLKVEPSFQPVAPETENCKSSVVSKTETELSQDAERKDHRQSDANVALKSGKLEGKEEVSDISEAFENVHKPRPSSEPGQHDLSDVSPKQETLKMKQEPNKEDLMKSPEDAPKSGKPKIMGVALTELFTPEQVREHIRGLRQWVGQVCIDFKTLEKLSFIQIYLIIYSSLH